MATVEPVIDLPVDRGVASTEQGHRSQTEPARESSESDQGSVDLVWRKSSPAKRSIVLLATGSARFRAGPQGLDALLPEAGSNIGFYKTH